MPDNNDSPRPQAAGAPGAVEDSPRPQAGEGPGVRAASSRKRCNPYAEVALTYFHCSFSSVGAGIMAFAWLFTLIIIRLTAADEYFPLTFLVVVGSASALNELFSHIKEQFANPRAHLMPEFRRVHATVGIAAIVAVVAASIMIWPAGHGFLGLAAIMAFLSGALLWFELRPTRWLSWLLMGVWFACSGFGSKPITGWLGRLASGELEVHAVVLLVAGAAATVLGAVRLFRLNEEMPEYHYRRPRRDDAADQGVTNEPIVQGGLRAWLADQQSLSMIQHAQRASTSWWSRARRWQAGMTSGWSVLAWSLGAVAVFQFFAWRIGESGSTPVDVRSFCLTYLAIIVSLVSLPQRLPALEYERLLPVGGVSYFRQVGAAFALSHLRLWGAMSLALVLWWSIMAWEPSQLGVLASALFVSACCQIWTLGAIVYLGRYRSVLPLGITFALAFGLPWPLLVGWLMEAENKVPVGLLLWAAFFGIVGVLFIWHAYRYWLAADMD